MAEHDEDYFFWEDAQKIAFCQKTLTELMPVLGGQIHIDRDDDRMELRTQLGPRPARVLIDFSSGWVETQLTLTNTLGVLVLSWDPDKQPKTQIGPWDEDKQLRYFIGPGVFIEEYEEEAKAMYQVVGQLPQPLVHEILQAMPYRFTHLAIDASRIELKFKPEVHHLENPPQLFSMVFGMLDRIASAFETGQNAVAARPKVYIGGKPMNTLGPVSCPFCNTIVDTSQGSFCPNCGSAVNND